MIILEDLSPEERREYIEEREKRNQYNKERLTCFSSKVGNYRYRCEQTVVNKIKNIINSHAETKREFDVRLSAEQNQPIVRTKMLESIITVNPVQLNEVMNLITEIDDIKAEATLMLNLTTGKIADILNLESINKKWFDLKYDIINRYKVSSGADAKEKMDQFLKLAEAPILNKKSFIEDLSSKIFFDVFFDKFLVSHDLFADKYTKSFSSYLFDQKPFTVSIEQQNESEQEISKSATLCDADWKMKTVEGLYNQKYKPMIGYSFSEYDFVFKQHLLLDEIGIPKEINTQIIERVQNNIEILVDYKLYRIEN